MSPAERARGEDRKPPEERGGQQGARGATGPSSSRQNMPLWQEGYFRLMIVKKHRRKKKGKKKKKETQEKLRSDPFEKSRAFLRRVSICEVVSRPVPARGGGSPSPEALPVPEAKTGMQDPTLVCRLRGPNTVCL